VPSQRRARQALHDHIVRLQAAVSCVSHAVVMTDQQEVWLSEQPMALGRDYTLILQQELHATLAGELRIWRYNYRIADANDQEIVAYHYHPGRHGYHHLHVPRGPLPKAAYPTGQIGPSQVIGFCIGELGVPPLRPDWKNVLAYYGS
jgi:hypothetical protein